MKYAAETLFSFLALGSMWDLTSARMKPTPLAAKAQGLQHRTHPERWGAQATPSSVRLHGLQPARASVMGFHSKNVEWCCSFQRSWDIMKLISSDEMITDELIHVLPLLQ